MKTIIRTNTKNNALKNYHPDSKPVSEAQLIAPRFFLFRSKTFTKLWYNKRTSVECVCVRHDKDSITTSE